MEAFVVNHFVVFGVICKRLVKLYFAFKDHMEADIASLYIESKPWVFSVHGNFWWYSPKTVCKLEPRQWDVHQQYTSSYTNRRWYVTRITQCVHCWYTKSKWIFHQSGFLTERCEPLMLESLSNGTNLAKTFIFSNFNLLRNNSSLRWNGNHPWQTSQKQNRHGDRVGRQMLGPDPSHCLHISQYQNVETIYEYSIQLCEISFPISTIVIFKCVKIANSQYKLINVYVYYLSIDLEYGLN